MKTATNTSKGEGRISLGRTARRHMSVACIVLVLLVSLSTEARADLYGFTRVTSNATVDVASQLFVDVTDPGGGQALFTFSNTGPVASSITDVYFDDDLPVLNWGSIAINGGSGVNFDVPATPANLPGAPAGFVATVSADSDPPVAGNGVGPGESLGLSFDIASGNVFADVIGAINLGFTTGVNSLRIGIHVQGIGAESQSDSFIMTPTPTPIPTPGALVLGSIGIGMVIVRLRRKTLAES